ncbi:MAG: hypothetical protein ACYC9S_03460 [Leptospirales bacterium]
MAIIHNLKQFPFLEFFSQYGKPYGKNSDKKNLDDGITFSFLRHQQDFYCFLWHGTCIQQKQEAVHL